MTLMHAVMRNQEHVDVQLWPFAMAHLCHLWNTVLKLNQFSSIELLSRTIHTRNYSDLRHYHVGDAQCIFWNMMSWLARNCRNGVHKLVMVFILEFRRHIHPTFHSF